jgi:hypothetical protein
MPGSSTAARLHELAAAPGGGKGAGAARAGLGGALGPPHAGMAAALRSAQRLEQLAAAEMPFELRALEACLDSVRARGRAACVV